MSSRLLGIAGVALVAASMLPAQPREQSQTITRHYLAKDRETGRYQYIPFDLPKDVAELEIAYQYDRAGGETVVDLGLFEPGPLDLGTKAFRGYSGGAKESLVINKQNATYGYKPGALPAGRWHVLLGLYRVADGGVTVRVTIRTRSSPFLTFSEPIARPLPEKPGGAGWFTGALHTHTVHSDGTITPAELMSKFRDARFDFVALTDHNNTTHTHDPELWRQTTPLWIIGEEVTTPGGHASVWGLPSGGWVDFRVLPGDARIRDLVASARKQGAMFSINHPASDCLACGWTHDIVEGIEGIEISNGRHGEVDKAIAMWDRLLVSGRRITGVGSSDWHSAPNPIDNANVRVRAAALTREAILGAVRAGRVIVMTNAQDATPEVVVRSGARTATIADSLAIETGGSVSLEVKSAAAAGGRLSIVFNGRGKDTVKFDAEGLARAEMPATRGYIRFEIVKADGSPLAYTNPVYLVQE
jgi:hypothetical protein